MAVGDGRHSTIYARLAGSGDTSWISESHGATTQPRGLGYVQHVCAFLAKQLVRRLGPERRTFPGVSFGTSEGPRSLLSTIGVVILRWKGKVCFLRHRECRDRQAADMAARKSLIR